MDIYHVRVVASFVVMIVFSVLDIRRKEIPAIPLFIYLGTGIVFGLLNGYLNEMLLTSLPGLFLIMLSFLSGEKIGYGDGITTCALGIWVGIDITMATLVVGMLSIGFMASVLIVRRRVKLHKGCDSERIPFIPFLLLGLAVSIISA